MSEHDLDPTKRIDGEPSKETKRELKKEMRVQLIGFLFMFFLTTTAFLSIASESIPSSFAFPFIAMLAVVQVILQLYIFMHLNGNTWPSALMWTALLIAIPTAASLVLLIGVTKF